MLGTAWHREQRLAEWPLEVVPLPDCCLCPAEPRPGERRGQSAATGAEIRAVRGRPGAVAPVGSKGQLVVMVDQFARALL